MRCTPLCYCEYLCACGVRDLNDRARAKVWNIYYRLLWSIKKPTLVNVYNIVIIINITIVILYRTITTGHGSRVRLYVYMYIYCLHNYLSHCILNVVVCTILYTSLQFGTYDSLKRFCQLYIHYIPNKGHLSASSDLSVTIRTNEM